MQQPSDITLLRSMRSVGPTSAAISGFKARALTIARQTRPRRLIRPQVEDLIALYLRRGFPLDDLRDQTRRLRI